jgi:hypothetical protein
MPPFKNLYWCGFLQVALFFNGPSTIRRESFDNPSTVIFRIVTSESLSPWITVILSLSKDNVQTAGSFLRVAGIEYV